jgi:sugar phosphate isomerase/epimerase
MTNKEFELAYQMTTVCWDGKMISREDESEIDSKLDVLQEAGISKVMLAGYQLEEPSDFDMFKESLRIGDKLKSRGMKASQHHGLAVTFAPLDSSQAGVKEKLKKVIEITANLGAESLVLHAGRVDEKYSTSEEYCRRFKEEEAKHGTDAVLAVSAENIRCAGELASQYDIKIAMENLDKFEPLSNMELLPKLIDAIDLPNAGYCLDSGHAHACGSDPVEWIKIMDQKLFTTHFHDNRGCPDWVRKAEGCISPSKIDEHLPPGFGTIAWIDVINALREIDYQYAVTFESGPWPMEDDLKGYKNAIDFWRATEKIAWEKSQKEKANT